MSLIAITYGYNQFSIFNTNVSTQSLIDNIIDVCFMDIIHNLQVRASTLQKEIDATSCDEENFKKTLKKLEQDKISEEKVAEALMKANEEANALKAKDTKGKQHPKPSSMPLKKGQQTTEGFMDNKVLLQITADIKVNQAGLSTVEANKEKFLGKKKKLMEILEEFKEISNNKSAIKIDLVDIHGEKVNINSKGDAYAYEYLQSRHCYELNQVTESKFGCYIKFFIYSIKKVRIIH